MKDFKVITKEKEVTISYPESIKDIPMDYIQEITKNIKVGDYHSLIALVYKAPIYNVILTYKQKKKGVDAKVIPLFIKSGKSDINSSINDAKPKDILIIPGSSLEFAYNVTPAGNIFSIDYLANILDDDANAARRALLDNFVAYFISFKIIANSEIKGFYANSTEKVENKYITVVDRKEE